MTFAAPLFLIAIAAVAIPVLLHMIHRQKPKQLPFSSLRFLRLSVQRTWRRKRIHDLLLLLLRVAAIALIALGLAQPTIQRIGNPLRINSRTAVVIVLDNSASMSTVDDATPRWQQAIDAVQQVLDQLDGNDSVGLLVSNGPSRPDSEQLFENHEYVRQAVDSLQISYEQADLSSLLKTAQAMLAKSTAPNKEIYVITDMQANAWPDKTAEGEAMEGETAEGEASEADTAKGEATEVPIVVVDVHSAPRVNVALQRVNVQAAAPVTGVPIQLMVELLGDANIDQKRHVELHLDGQKQQVSPTISIDARQPARHTFQIEVDEPGVHRGELRLVGEDACPFDDRLFFTLTLQERIPVTVVKAENHPIPYLDDAYYLERALVPVSDSDWAVQVRTLTPAALASRPLTDQAVVFCVNLPALEKVAAQRLWDYIKSGGHVVWICGDNVDPARYAMMGRDFGLELIPIKMIAVREPPADQPDGWHIGWLDDTYPALESLVEPPSLFQSVLVHKHLRLAKPDAGTRVLAKLNDGEALLVQRQVGAGSVSLLATTVHVDWTNLPLRPLFLPLVSRLTFHLAEANMADSNVVSGTPLVVSLSAEDANAQIEVTNPAGNVERITQGQESSLTYSETHQVGVYDLRLLNTERPRHLAYAINHDAGEAALAMLQREELEQRLAAQTVVFCQDPADVLATVREFRTGNSLLEVFLIAVLITLVAETFVANRRINRERSAAAAGHP